MNTETLDKLYLEWAQFTKARNRREVEALALLNWLDRKGGLGFDVHEELRKGITLLAGSPP